MIISDNKLKQLPSYSKLNYLKCDNNRINKFANYSKLNYLKLNFYQY